MSVLSLALQIAATGALAEVMPPWVRVEMEPVEPLALADGENRVILAVFTGDEIAKTKLRRWLDATVTVELALQVILPAEVKATVEGRETTFNTRRGGTRAVYAAVHRLIERLFAVPDDGGDLTTWAGVLRTLVVDHDGDLVGMPFVAERPGKDPLPFLDFTIPCKLVKSPAFGRAPPRPWPQLVALMRATPDFAEAADHVEALLAGEPLPPWLADQARAGLSSAAGDALGLGPDLGTLPEESGP